MPIEIKVPPLGESITEVTVGHLLKPSGSSVRAEEEIVELETDKVNQVLSAPEAGVLRWRVAVGERLSIGALLGEIEVAPSGKGLAPPAAKVESPGASPARELPAMPMPPEAPRVAETLAEEASKPLPPPPPREVRTRMSLLRRTLGEQLLRAKQQTAMLTTFNEVDLSALLALRAKEQAAFQERHGVRLGMMSFFVKAAVAALRAFPEVNAAIEGEEIVSYLRYDIGVAIATERGLIVPVLRDCDQLSFGEIERAIVDYAEKARRHALSVDMLRGGTFTITNGGKFGSLLSTPILNSPQSAILGMHAIVKRPVVVEGDLIAARPMMYLALSYDHRAVDGREAVLFLAHIKKDIEEPGRLLLAL